MKAKDRQRLKDQLDQADAEESLLKYAQLMWPVLEPGRTMASGWALEAICEHLEAVTHGEIKNLLIMVPPGSAKSLLTNVFWPTWMWGPKDLAHKRFLAWSYSETLTTRDNRKTREIVESPLYQRLWGSRFKIKNNAVEYIENDRTGFKQALSIHGSATGHRGDYLLLDDPHNVKDGESDARREAALRFVSETLPSRGSDDDSATVIIMQRIHQQDVCGYILEHDAAGWDVLCLPMEYEPDHPVQCTRFNDPRTELGELFFPERFSKESVERLKANMRMSGTDYAIASQLQQRPTARGGGMFKKDDLLISTAYDRNGSVVRGWDLAASKRKRSPYTVGTKMRRTADGRYVIEHVIRKRLEPGGVERLIRETAEADGLGVKISIPQDPGQAGKAQKLAFAKALAGYNVVFSPESGSKEQRAEPMAAQAAAGNLLLAPGAWNQAFIDEATHFPYSTFKDQVDAASRAFSELIVVRKPNPGALPQVKVFRNA